MKLIDRGSGHFRLGRLLLSWPVRQGEGTSIVDGCTTNFDRHEDDGTLIERVGFGGVAIRPPWSPNAVAVTWRGARMRNPGRWFRWEFVKARIRWEMAGRPPAKPMTTFGSDYVVHAGRPDDVA